MSSHPKSSSIVEQKVIDDYEGSLVKLLINNTPLYPVLAKTVLTYVSIPIVFWNKSIDLTIPQLKKINMICLLSLTSIKQDDIALWSFQRKSKTIRTIEKSLYSLTGHSSTEIQHIRRMNFNAPQIHKRTRMIIDVFKPQIDELFKSELVLRNFKKDLTISLNNIQENIFNEFNLNANNFKHELLLSYLK